MSSWECPYCNRLATESAVQNKVGELGFNADTKDGPLHFKSIVMLCPNPECKEYVFKTLLTRGEVYHGLVYESNDVLDIFTIKPQGIAKTFPNYIPQAILEDYREAALIKGLSPKASATLSRRCLQGMIRDFWQINKPNLFEEIKAIEDKVDSDTWYAIDAIRSIGNIGAHMEKDINLIIDVDPDEAELLINLIENLIKDWYIEKENRRVRAQAIIDSAKDKKALKQK